MAAIRWVREMLHGAWGKGAGEGGLREAQDWKASPPLVGETGTA